MKPMNAPLSLTSTAYSPKPCCCQWERIRASSSSLWSRLIGPPRKRVTSASALRAANGASSAGCHDRSRRRSVSITPRRYGPFNEGDAAEAALGNLNVSAWTEVLAADVRWRALHPVASLFAAPNRVCSECAMRYGELQEAPDEDCAICDVLWDCKAASPLACRVVDERYVRGERVSRRRRHLGCLVRYMSGFGRPSRVRLRSRQRYRLTFRSMPEPCHAPGRRSCPRTKETRLPKPLRGTSPGIRPESRPPSLVASPTPRWLRSLRPRNRVWVEPVRPRFDRQEACRSDPAIYGEMRQYPRRSRRSRSALRFASRSSLRRRSRSLRSSFWSSRPMMRIVGVNE